MKILVKVVLALLYISTGTAPVIAQPDETFLSLSSPNTGFGDRTPNQKDGAFYRSFAKPTRDQPQQVSEVGAWRFETDTRTKLAYPRVVRLSRNRPVNHVNDALAAIHGRMIRWALENDRWVARNRPGVAWEPGSSIMQTIIKVTYFSAKYLSIVELGIEQGGGNRQSPFARGITVDVGRGTIFSVKACDSDHKLPTFTFGSLLAVCTDTALALFRDLWIAQAVELAKDVPRLVPDDDDLEVCRLRALAYIDRDTFFSLYLTDSGLAVHNAWSVSNGENQCVEAALNPFNPVIIPYRKLEPLMRPGLLRDELLTIAVPQAP